MINKTKIKTLLIAMVFVMTTAAIATPVQAYTNLAVTSNNLNTLNSFTYSGA